MGWIHITIDVLDETSKFGKGNERDTTTGETIGKSKEFDNSECSEEIDNEGVIIASSFEDNRKENEQKENQWKKKKKVLFEKYAVLFMH